MSTTSHETIVTRFTNVNAGIDRHITSSVTLGGTSYTPAALKAVFTAGMTAIQAADAARKAWESDIVTAKTATKTADDLYAAFRSYLVGIYGKTAVTTLNDFGMSVPKKASAQTAATKAAAVVKRTATRTARHTMGTAQKKSIKGNVTGIVVTPVTTTTAPETPVGAPAPSPTAPASPAAPSAPVTHVTGTAGPAAGAGTSS